MGKFLGSFTSNSKQQSSSRPNSACASPVSVASAPAATPPGPHVGPLTMGHQAAAKEQQQLPHMVADVMTEETERLSMPVAVVSRLQAATSDNSKKQQYDVQGVLPQAQLQYSNLAGKMLHMVNDLRATGQCHWPWQLLLLLLLLLILWCS